MRGVYLHSPVRLHGVVLVKAQGQLCLYLLPPLPILVIYGGIVSKLIFCGLDDCGSFPFRDIYNFPVVFP